METSIAKAIAEEVGRLVRELQPAGHPDDLVELPGPLQRRTAMGLVRSGKLRARKIGQHWYTTRRHLAALVDDDAGEGATIDPDAILRGHIQRRRR